MGITGTGFIPRKDFMVMANVGTIAVPKWELIGERIEEMSLAMNPNIETVSDIRGFSETTLDRYQVQTEVAPMRARRDSELFAMLYDIVKHERTLSEVEKEFLCVAIFDSTETGEGDAKQVSYAAWKQRGIIAIESFGGGTAGLDIPFSIHWVGEKQHGSYTNLTFTAQ